MGRSAPQWYDPGVKFRGDLPENCLAGAQSAGRMWRERAVQATGGAAPVQRGALALAGGRVKSGDTPRGYGLYQGRRAVRAGARRRPAR